MFPAPHLLRFFPLIPRPGRHFCRHTRLWALWLCPPHFSQQVKVKLNPQRTFAKNLKSPLAVGNVGERARPSNTRRTARRQDHSTVKNPSKKAANNLKRSDRTQPHRPQPSAGARVLRGADRAVSARDSSIAGQNEVPVLVHLQMPRAPPRCWYWDRRQSAHFTESVSRTSPTNR